MSHEKRSVSRRGILGLLATTTMSGCLELTAPPSKRNEANIKTVSQSAAEFETPEDEVTFVESPNKDEVKIKNTVLLHNGCAEFDYQVENNTETDQNEGINVNLYSEDNSGGNIACTAVVNHVPVTITIEFKTLRPNQKITVNSWIGDEVSYITKGEKNEKTIQIKTAVQADKNTPVQNNQNTSVQNDQNTSVQSNQNRSIQNNQNESTINRSDQSEDTN